MMRKKIAAGNWKMNTLPEEAHELFHSIADTYEELGLNEQKQVILAPPFLYIVQLAEWAKDYPYLHIAAQNCHSESKGAFTGEISAIQLAAAGATHVIIGHSERRAYFSETNAQLEAKTKAALAAGLTPIFCCGETLEIRDNENCIAYIINQLKASLGMLSKEEFSQIILAYEPVWAIGTGKTASPEQAQEVHASIRHWISQHFSNEIAERCTILYGGSCNAQNAADLFSRSDVDGGLIGGASLNAETFLPIIQNLPA